MNKVLDPTTSLRPLLSTTQMAEFVTNGFLRFDSVIPPETCERAIQEMKSGTFNGNIYRYAGIPLDDMFKDLAVGQALREPLVAGAIESLVGPGPRFDHMCAHLIPAKWKKGADLHQDSEVDRRFTSFDIQISFFFDEVKPESGGTLFVPGTHFRRVRIHDLERYHYVRGQVQTVCPAGSIVIWHHNLWHSGRTNFSEKDRYMFKVRLNPQVPQVKLWDCSDLQHKEVAETFSRVHPWSGNEHRAEFFNRIRLWRSLIGDPLWDVDSWWTRVECQGQNTLSRPRYY